MELVGFPFYGPKYDNQEKFQTHKSTIHASLVEIQKIKLTIPAKLQTPKLFSTI
jgi:hypothetical protein